MTLMDFINNKLMEEIKRKRKQFELSQDFIAKKLGITQSQYQRIESGKSELSLERLGILVELLKIEEDLVTDYILPKPQQQTTGDNDKSYLALKLIDDRLKALESKMKSIDEIDSLSPEEKEFINIIRLYLKTHHLNLKTSLEMINEEPEYFLDLLFANLNKVSVPKSGHSSTLAGNPYTPPSQQQVKKKVR